MIKFQKLLSATAFALTAFAVVAPHANAIVIINAKNSGTNVLFDAAGSLDLTGLSGPYNHDGINALHPNTATITLGLPGELDLYNYVTRPSSFGTSINASVISSTGTYFGFDDRGWIGVTQGYVSGTAFTSSATFAGSIASLGLTQGTYEWTWGSGDHADKVVLNIPSVPDVGSTIGLLGLGIAGLTLVRRRFQS